MPSTTEKGSQTIATLLNGTIQSVSKTIPFEVQIGKPQAHGQGVNIQFGVMIGITGDVKGQILFSGPKEAFGMIGHSMFGMEIEEEMLNSFCGELGNMITGQLATIISENGVTIDITSPTILEGETKLTGYKNSLAVPISFQESNELDIYLLLDH